MKTIYKFFWDCGRSGNLEGVFVSTTEEVSKVIGKNIYFGEVLGKHSEIYGILEETDLKIITDNPDFIELFEKFDLTSGYNPLDYYEENQENV